MNIYICDDEKTFLGKADAICKEIAEQEQVEYQIFHGENGREALLCQEPIDILILDIAMPVMDGIQVKDWFQFQKRDMSIIFLTNHQERMVDAFGIHVVGFVDKSKMDVELRILLQKCIRSFKSYIMIEGKYDSRDIVYIEAAHVYSKLTGRQGESYLLRVPLAELEEKLEAVGFIRTHRSYLINMKYIEGPINDKVMVNETQIPVSVRLRKKVREAYKSYCRENERIYK